MTYNNRSPAVKRLMKEAQELSKPTELYFAQPYEDNLFEWHFTIRGPSDSEFDGGIYHGKILLPSDYPMKPPNIIFLTANGRFETNKKICLSISGYHPESWRPSWSIRTAMLAVIGFMTTPGAGSIGSLDFPKEERKRLAKASVHNSCDGCGKIATLLLPLTEASQNDIKEAKEAAHQMTFTEKQETASPTPQPAKPPTTENSATESAPTPPSFPTSVQTPFWICFPYYPWSFGNGDVLNMQMPNFMNCPPFVMPPVQSGASNTAKPMTFEQFVKKKREDERAKPEAKAEPVAEPSSSRPEPSATSAPPEPQKPVQVPSAEASETKEAEPAEQPKVVTPEPTVEVDTKAAPESDAAAQTLRQRRQAAAQALMQQHANRHRARSSRLLSEVNTHTTVAPAQSRSRVTVLVYVCSFFLVLLLVRRFLSVLGPAALGDF